MTDDDLKHLLESMRQENAAAHSETRRHFEVVADETRRHFDVVTEGTRKDIQLVAESVLLLGEKLTRTDEKIDRTAAETQAMIKFSQQRRTTAGDRCLRTPA